MDDIDRRIIAALTDDAIISATDLAAMLPMILSATAERLRRLHASGVISRTTVEIDPVAVNRSIQAFVDVRLVHDADLEAVEAGLRAQVSVINAVHLTGPFDMQLRVAARDVAELNELLQALKDDLGAAETNTRLVLNTVEGFPRPVAV